MHVHAHWGVITPNPFSIKPFSIVDIGNGIVLPQRVLFYTLIGRHSPTPHAIFFVVVVVTTHPYVSASSLSVPVLVPYEALSVPPLSIFPLLWYPWYLILILIGHFHPCGVRLEDVSGVP